jgi:hypothetical protein
MCAAAAVFKQKGEKKSKWVSLPPARATPCSLRAAATWRRKDTQRDSMRCCCRRRAASSSAASGGAVRRVLVVDLDVHQGNGVARDKLAAGDADICIVDM